MEQELGPQAVFEASIGLGGIEIFDAQRFEQLGKMLQSDWEELK